MKKSINLKRISIMYSISLGILVIGLVIAKTAILGFGNEIYGGLVVVFMCFGDARNQWKGGNGWF